jgi:GNAT superfamily N-acetyltransferase
VTTSRVLVEVRSARVEDAPALASLSAQLGYPVPPDLLADRLARILDRMDELVLVACTPAGAIIGWAHGAEQRFLEADVRCELLGLVVDSGHRREGVGQRLVSAVERWAEQRGLVEISVRSNVVRVESHQFYERRGYQRLKTQHVYRKPIRGAIG